jgi:hypothetical protein
MSLKNYKFDFQLVLHVWYCGMSESCYIVCCLQYFVEAGAMAVRRCKKADLKRIAKATGAAYLTSLSNMEGTYHSVLRLAHCSCGRCIF